MEQYIISTGKLSAMYTLKAYFEQDIKLNRGGTIETATIKGYQYIQNLSTDKEKALEKAQLITGTDSIKFCAPEDLNEYQEGLAEEKRAIEKAKQEAKEKKLKDQMLLVDLGIYPFTGQKFADFTVKTINQWLEMTGLEGIALYIQEHIKNNYKHLALPKPTKSTPWGNEKERKSFKATVTAVIVFDSFDYRGWPTKKAITKFVTDDGYLLTTFTDCPGLVGDTVTGKGTVKKFEEYKGEHQTIIQRVKID